MKGLDASHCVAASQQVVEANFSVGYKLSLLPLNEQRYELPEPISGAYPDSPYALKAFPQVSLRIRSKCTGKTGSIMGTAESTQLSKVSGSCSHGFETYIH